MDLCQQIINITAMALTIELEALGFTGFYQGIWDQGENEYCETRELRHGEYEDILDLQLLDDWGFGPDYRDNIAKLYAEAYIELVNDTLGTDFKLLSQSVYSPQYYNFRTDEIYCKVEIEDWDNTICRLRELCNDSRYKDGIVESIRRNHTSCDGFVSFMDNELDEWLESIEDPNDTRYISCLVGYLVNVINVSSLRGLNESVYSWATEQGYQETEPETDESKEEWDLYLKYRDVYTDYSRNHPMRYANPNKGAWPNYIVVDWDDYKEDFLEVAAKYEEELKHKAALAAQPVIPGLFDDETDIPTA